MPKTTTDSLIADLTSRLGKLVAAARKEGRDEALLEVRELVGGGTGGAARRGPGRPRKAAKPETAAKPKKKRKNPWATMTPRQKADRVRKMLAGRGLKPKAERKPVAEQAAKPKKKRKNSWAGQTPAQRLKRVNAIRKGRGLPLRKKLQSGF